MEFMAIMVWAGGAFAALDQVGFLRAVIWPLYLGRFLAKVALRDYFQAKSK